MHSLKGFVQKNLEATLLFVDFSKAFDSIHRGTMNQILVAYGLPKETVVAIMILYEKNKSKSSLTRWRHRRFWNFRWCVARGHSSTIPIYYLPRLRVSNVDRFNERKQLYFGKGKKQTIPCINDYGRGLHWWHSVSGKYTYPSRISAA